MHEVPALWTPSSGGGSSMTTSISFGAVYQAYVMRRIFTKDVERERYDGLSDGVHR